MHYQPQIDLRTGRMIGAEALLRWFSPRLGIVSPADFIPVAEETGAIVPISEWVLRESVKQGRRWMEAGLADFKRSVNLSARQFREPKLVSRIKEILEEFDYPASTLCLEITESAVIEQLDQALAVVREINALGVSLAIDDFGTGYSSLAMLNRLPFRTVKLDKSLIRGIGKDRKDAAVVRLILSLSRRLEMEALAEGVETEEHMAQGYLLGRPMPAGDIREWQINWKNQGMKESAMNKATIMSDDLEGIWDNASNSGLGADIQQIAERHGLTPREKEVFAMLAKYGCTNREIAEQFMISEKTVKIHISNIMNKLDIRSIRKLYATLLNYVTGVK